MQGYLFSRARPVKELSQFFAAAADRERGIAPDC
jgi:hypothetical protein